LRTAHKSQDIAQIDTAVAALNTAWTAASEEMYKAGQDGGAQPGGDGTGQQQQQSAGSENVTDAEFEEVKYRCRYAIGKCANKKGRSEVFMRLFSFLFCINMCKLAESSSLICTSAN
jgi:hypothetical protein